MIGKIPEKRKDGGSSFFSLAKYILHGDDGDSRVVYANTRNTFCELDDDDEWAWQTVAAEMNALGTANVRCADPVFHFVLSFRPEEVPTTAQVDESVEIALKELNLENCKVLYGLQNDNGIHHIHVSVCRIDPETEKAIKPAGGWTKKALTKAARKIELAQGWEILRDDPFWDVTDDGQVVKKSYAPHDEKPKLDSNAKDLEAHMGEKSAQRIAVERGSEVIRNSRSWSELHEKLGDVGLRFERKGSGAVIFVGDEAVKASVIGRDCSLSKLEARLGVFQESTAIVKNMPNLWNTLSPSGTNSRNAKKSNANSCFKPTGRGAERNSTCNATFSPGNSSRNECFFTSSRGKKTMRLSLFLNYFPTVSGLPKTTKNA